MARIVATCDAWGEKFKEAIFEGHSILPFQYDTFEKRETVILSRCHIVNNMTKWTSLS